MQKSCNCWSCGSGTETGTTRRAFLGVLGAGLAATAFPEIVVPKRAYAQAGLKTLPSRG
jgi:hypothetical protein